MTVMKVGYFKVKPAVPAVRTNRDILSTISVTQLPAVKPEIKTPARRGLRVLALPAIGLLLVLFLIGGSQSLDLSRYQPVTNINLPANVSFLSQLYDTVIGWGQSFLDWLIYWWLRLVDCWHHFWTGQSPVSSELRAQIRQEVLRELQQTGGQRYGLLTVPTASSTLARAELIKNNLTQMFADPVNLKFDLTRTSGTIQPIFRNGQQGGDFVFVLTPVK